MQGKQLDPIPLLLPLNLLLLVPFGHLLEKVKTKVLERWCALPLSLLYSFSAAAVTASWQLHTVNRFMKAMCIQALPSTLLSCQEQNNLGNVYSSRSIHIVYVYSSPCVHIHHVYLSSTFFKIHFLVQPFSDHLAHHVWPRNVKMRSLSGSQNFFLQKTISIPGRCRYGFFNFTVFFNTFFSPILQWSLGTSCFTKECEKEVTKWVTKLFSSKNHIFTRPV